jgi:sugar-specific transcriptional regulator TrmB
MKSNKILYGTNLLDKVQGIFMEDWLRLAEILNKQLGLTPYESRAYVSLMVHGPMSPSELAQKTGIPRPRSYDVLKSLTEKGLLVEQSGRPSIYAAVEPTQGLKNLLIAVEMETLMKLEEKRKIAQTSTKLLSQMYEKSKSLKLERSKVWFTRRDTAFIAMYTEAIRSFKKEFLVATNAIRSPEEEIIEAVKYSLKTKGKSIRVVRQITELWTLEELERYKEYIRAGSQVRYLNSKEIPLRFMVFDERDVILVFPSESELTMPQALEALWFRIPPLAKILREHFEELWKKGKPILPILREIKKKKQKGKKR